ncbi:MAG TPA: hypothetical protein VL985_05930 [Stellaceae bacterium]|nr:hypothetical protein [Stellaceae bacterium]
MAETVVGGIRRAFGFACGKAIAFTYAVIVSVVANIVFQLVHEPPPHIGLADPATDGANGVPARRAAIPMARAALPAPAEPIKTVNAAPSSLPAASPAVTGMPAATGVPAAIGVNAPPGAALPAAAPMPAPAASTAEVNVAPNMTAPPAARMPEPPHPGPGSGGLY